MALENVFIHLVLRNVPLEYHVCRYILFKCMGGLKRLKLSRKLFLSKGGGCEWILEKYKDVKMTQQCMCGCGSDPGILMGQERNSR